jgi:hypothetical protein
MDVHEPDNDAWIASYAAYAIRLRGAPSVSAAVVAFAEEAPGAYLRDTGQRPPVDLLARVIRACNQVLERDT